MAVGTGPAGSWPAHRLRGQGQEHHRVLLRIEIRSFLHRRASVMLRNARIQCLLVLALGGLLGYGAATGRFSSQLGADKEKRVAPGKGIEVTGEPGSPSATTTIPGNQLPPPPPKF